VLVALVAVRTLLLPSGVGSVSLGSGRMEAAPMLGRRRPRPVVIWTTWIGAFTLALNASSLVWFLLVFPSFVAALLFWLMPFSMALGVADISVFLRERLALSTSSAPPRQWAVTLALSLSIGMFLLVVLCIVLFHDAQLGNLDPGGL
jgi:hypothetical protein